MVLADVVEFLICPHCGGDLRLDERVVVCALGHTFDVARQGYVNLLPGGARAGTADTAAMVAARVAFLDRGHFAPLISAVTDAARAADPQAAAGCVVDLGAGPGAYLAAVLDTLPDRAGVALDVSKYAMRRAARAHPRIGAAVCDIWWQVPVRAGAAALVLNVFAPRNGDEIARILRPDGSLLVVTPTPDHLAEIVAPLGLLTVDAGKAERVERELAPRLHLVDRSHVAFTMALRPADVVAVAAMGPSAWHVDADEVARRIRDVGDLLHVTASITLTRYRARRPAPAARAPA